MKKIAVFEVEFDSDDMISEEDLKSDYNNDWLKFMQELFKDDGFGIFDEEFKLVEIKKPCSLEYMQDLEDKYNLGGNEDE